MAAVVVAALVESVVLMAPAALVEVGRSGMTA